MWPKLLFRERQRERNNSLRISKEDHQVVFSHPGLVTYVCGCAGSSPRVTLLPWISLKHFSQKWYLSAIRPYLGELQPAHTVAAQANRHTGGRMQSERRTWQQPRTEHGQRKDGRTHTYTHRQRYRLVTTEMIMIQPLSFKLKHKLGGGMLEGYVNETWTTTVNIKSNVWQQELQFSTQNYVPACWNTTT